MGDRICLTFAKDNDWHEGERDYSPVLYAHWDGMTLIERAVAFWEEYHGTIRDDPTNWMVNFLNYLRGGEITDGGYYISIPGSEPSPDDCGYWEFDTRTGEYRQTEKGEWE